MRVTSRQVRVDRSNGIGGEGGGDDVGDEVYDNDDGDDDGCDEDGGDVTRITSHPPELRPISSSAPPFPHRRNRTCGGGGR